MSYRMKCHAAIKYFGVIYLSIVLFWYATGAEIIQEQFKQFQSFKCDNLAVCATSRPWRAFAIRSQAQCTVECQLQESCVGVNFLGIDKTCEIFASIPTNVSQTVAGCQYFQKAGQKNVCCYTFGYQPEALVASLNGSPWVQSIALLNGQLFSSRYNVGGRVSVYDTSSYQLLHQITLPGASSRQFGMASSVINNYLYITDWHNKAVYRVDVSVTYTDSIIQWNVPGNPRGISVTRAGNVLVVINPNTISEYTPSGSLVRSVTVTDSNTIWQAVEVNSSVWAFSRYGSLNGIAMISTNGTIIKSFGSAAGSTLTQMIAARGLAVDNNGYFLVTDINNGRILVVDPSLSVARQLKPPINPAMRAPAALSLDQARRLLYIGENLGQAQERLLVFGGI